MAEENRKLNSLLRRMITNYDDLQKQTKRVDGSQIFSPENRSEDNFNFRILSRRSHNTDSTTAVSHHPSDSHEQVGDKDGKNTRFMDDQQRPSHKRKINHLQLDQFQNGMINPSMEESPTKKHQGLSNDSFEHTAPVTKKIVSVRTKSEASVISDGCRWRKYGQKSTRNNPCPKSYYRCATAPSCPVKKQVQRCAQDPTIIITTYEDEHTHSLSPLAIAAMRPGLSNHLVGREMNTENFVTGNQFIPCTARISTSSPFPTIILDLTDNRFNPELQVQHPQLGAGSFQHLPTAPNDISQELDKNQSVHSSIMDCAASKKADPNFSAALAVAIAGSMLNLCSPVQAMRDFRHGAPCCDGSSEEAFI